MIRKIKDNISILQLLTYLGTKPTKSNFILSIYKSENTPSLKIYPDTNTFYCFATNQGGDVIKFYADFYKIEIKQSINELCKIFGLKYNYKENGVSNNYQITNKNCYYLLETEKDIFEERAGIIQYEGKLNRVDAEKIAFNQILNTRKEIQTKIFESIYNFCISSGFDERVYSYLIGYERGLTDQYIKKNKLFNIKSVKELIEFLRDNFTKEEISLAGLFKNKYFLFTRHRLIIPYIENNKIVYLRGRYFFNGKSNPENFCKYIGLNNWSLTLTPKRFFNTDLLNELNPFEKLIITEGEFDCIITNQIGYKAIGVPGVSNFPENKINLIKNYNIHLAFDSDVAGEKAIEKISKLFDVPIKIIRLKVHKDLTELFNDRK